MTRITRITRLARILAATATIALVAGLVFAQGPRAANTARGWSAPADAATVQPQIRTRTQLRDPEADHDPAIDPGRDRVRDPAQQRVDVDDVAGRRPGPVGGAATADAFGPRHAALAEALGMPAEELWNAIAEGATWSDLAEEAGVSLDQMPIGAGGLGRPNRADGPQAGAVAQQGRMQQDAPQARRGWGRF